MTKRIRLVILALCALMFFTITPYILLYSLGYRVDFKQWKIVSTGGIYVKVVPEPANVTVDSHITNATGLFSSSVFVQDLLPTIHSVLIKKDGYYDYQKNLMVKENQVTKLEHVVLIPKIIAFSPIETTGDNFWIAPNNTTLLLATLNPASVGLEIINLSTQQKQIVTLPLQKPTMPTVQWSADSNNALINSNTAYFLLPVSASSPAITKLAYSSGATNASFNPQDASQIFYLKNKNLYQGTQVLPVIKNVVAYHISNATISWLAYDGFFYNSDIATVTPEAVTTQPIVVKNTATYHIFDFSGMLFLQENNTVLLLNQKTGAFEPFSDNIVNMNISPDGQKILYYNANQITLYHLNAAADKRTVALQTITNALQDVSWFGNDYIVASVGDNIIISEIDARNNVNSVTLPKTITLSGTMVALQQPRIFFNQQDKKLYVLTQHSLAVSQSLIP